jgi:hypothetical protein
MLRLVTDEDVHDDVIRADSVAANGPFAMQATLHYGLQGSRASTKPLAAS